MKEPSPVAIALDRQASSEDLTWEELRILRSRQLSLVDARLEIEHALRSHLIGELKSSLMGGAGILLTNREREILTLIDRGHTADEIAQELVLSLSTIKSHTSSLLRKLGAKNRTQAIHFARELGLL